MCTPWFGRLVPRKSDLGPNAKPLVSARPVYMNATNRPSMSVAT